ncbi:MFS transporter [Sulfobacillus thermosulfidooxidans]|uniref:MFS transporter n=1 Tax=Sulfobacillus thermosulfidooxidans TaxID=28034 RepID=UPI0004229BEA|nr:MFS transporter [Sulfobacillus thermosulfidooxidans]
MSHAQRNIRQLPRSFWALVAGDMLSTLGVSIYTLVILYIVQQYSSNILLNGFVGALSHIPPVIAGFGLGVLVDRMSRKRAMVMANFFVAMLAWIPLWANLHTVWGYTLVVLTDFFIQTAMYWEQLGHNAYVKFLVPPEHLARSEGILQSLASLGFPVGMIWVFLIVGHGPIRWLLGISAGVAGIVGLITWIFLPADPLPLQNDSGGRPWELFEEGLRWIKEVPSLLWYVYQTVFANGAINILMALIIYDMGHQGLFHHVPIIAVLGAGLGMGLGGLTVSTLSSRIRLLWLIIFGRLVFALGLIGIPQKFSIFAVAASLTLIFWGQNVSGTALVTWRTQSTPLAHQGRISSTVAQISSLTSWTLIIGVSALDQVTHHVALGFYVAASLVLVSLAVIGVGMKTGHFRLPRYLGDETSRPPINESW